MEIFQLVLSANMIKYNITYNNMYPPHVLFAESGIILVFFVQRPTFMYRWAVIFALSYGTVTSHLGLIVQACEHYTRITVF